MRVRADVFVNKLEYDCFSDTLRCLLTNIYSKQKKTPLDFPSGDIG